MSAAWKLLDQKMEAYGDRCTYEVPASEIKRKTVNVGGTKVECVYVEHFNMFGNKLSDESVSKVLENGNALVEVFYSRGD